MTPAARQKWVRQALQIVLEGSAELSDGVEALGRAIGALPSATDRKAITVLVRRGLRNRLRDRTATIRIGASLPEKINQDLEKFAAPKGSHCRAR
jgi:hypothetical protein